ncbi:MAG: ankyrin repeat domain-containing protein [Phycisphaeraceae bacterium]|nr:ankyrin repeat domain-containing protein [Phycisphaeraceae bacterium]
MSRFGNDAFQERLSEATGPDDDPNHRGDGGATPLHLSYETLSEYEQVVPFMLERGADPRLRDRWGQTVIDLARRMIAGEHPRWRLERSAADGVPPCGWKTPAETGDAEYRMLQRREAAALRS